MKIEDFIGELVLAFMTFLGSLFHQEPRDPRNLTINERASLRQNLDLVSFAEPTYIICCDQEGNFYYKATNSFYLNDPYITVDKERFILKRFCYTKPTRGAIPNAYWCFRHMNALRNEIDQTPMFSKE